MLEPLPVHERRLSGHPSAQDDRRRWLTLACELDRLKAARTLREVSTGFHVNTVLEKIVSVAPDIPGRLGKWLRGASVAATVCRVAFLAFKG